MTPSGIEPATFRFVAQHDIMLLPCFLKFFVYVLIYGTPKQSSILTNKAQSK